MKKLALAALLLPSLAFAQGANDAGVNAPNTFTGITARDVNGTLTFTGTEATMSPRFFRPGLPGDPCATFGAGNFQYQEVPFTSDASGQLTVDFDPSASCDVNIYVTFHTAFNPTNICSGFLWAHGSSTAFTGTFPVPANSPVTMVVSGVPNAPGVVCGPATFSIQGGNVGGGAPSADVQVTLSDAPDPVAAGSALTYVATVTNAGPDAADDVGVSLPLPAGTTFVSAVATGGGSCTTASPVTCTWAGALTASSTVTATIVANVGTSAAGTTLTATATASSTTADPDTANNAATATTAVGAPAAPAVALPVDGRLMWLLLAALVVVGGWQIRRQRR